MPAFNKLREQGKTRFIGFTAIGETAALHKLIASGAFDGAQVPFNVLNPSSAGAMPAAYPAQDYGRILDLAEKHGVGPSSSACWPAAPLGPRGAQSARSADGRADRLRCNVYNGCRRARRLDPMLREGHAGSLTELAMRFAIAARRLSTTEIGLANIEELEAAIAAVEKGPLSEAALARLRQLQAGFIGEAR